MSDALQSKQIEAIWRNDSPRLIAGLVRYCDGDIGAAEELAQDSFVKAIEIWPEQGVPDSPIAWLTTTARNMAIDRTRKHRAEQLPAVDEVAGFDHVQGILRSPPLMCRSSRLGRRS